MGTINSSDRIAAILYSLGTWFVSGICVNTLHKGDSIFTNNNINNSNNNNNKYRMFVGKPLDQRPFSEVTGLKCDIKMG
jgi:hypothetical protein